MPLLTGLLGGFLVAQVLAPALQSRLLETAAGAVAAAALTTLLRRQSRRRTPDAIEVDAGELRLCHDERVVHRLQLRKLRDVNQVETPSGPVLIVGDARRTLVLAAAQMADPRRYQSLSTAIVDEIARLDPSGDLGRRAVKAGRARLAVAQQPVRATWLLAGALALGSVLSEATLERVVARPFPLEAIGAFSAPLATGWNGEAWRFLSYVFIHADELSRAYPPGSSGLLHLLVNVWALVWLGSYLEKLLGWERLLFAFVAGTVGGAVACLFVPPMALTGASGGVFGLLGLLFALAAARRRNVPGGLVPLPTFWLVNLVLVLALVLFVPALLAPTLPAMFVQSAAALGGGLADGFVAGLLALPGLEVPPPPAHRKLLRPFGWAAAGALALGFGAGASHAVREHPGEDQLIARALLELDASPRAAELLNFRAYPMLVTEKPTAESITIGEQLASAAVEATGRRDASILDTLAVARYRQGRPDEARDLLEEALRLPVSHAMRQILEKRLAEIGAGQPPKP